MRRKYRAPRVWACDLVGRLRAVVPMGLRAKPGQLSPLFRLVSALLVATVLISCSLVPRKVQKPASTPASGQSKVEPVIAPVLPAPPVPLAMSLRDPQESARILVDALAGPDKLAAWLGLYDALGVPVIGQDGVSLGKTGDDPIGPRFWQVWYASGLDRPGRGILLSDAGRLLGAGFPEMDGVAFGPVLISDLKLAVQSSDPQARLLGAFVRERVLRGPSRADLLDPAATSETAVIDLPTVQLLEWIALRGALLRPDGKAALPDRLGPVFVDYRLEPPQKPVRASLSQTPCSDKFSGDDAERMMEKILNKNSKEFQMPAVVKPLPGIMAAIERALGMDSKKNEEVSKLLKNKLTLIASVMALGMQISALEINNLQDPDPLERTKSTSDGNSGKIIWALYSDPGQIPDDAKPLAVCFVLYGSTAGVPFKLPADGRIAKAKLEFKGGQGFTDLVQFADVFQGSSGPRDLQVEFTDDKGEVKLNVTGRGQKRQLPEDAKAVDKKFSIFVSALPIVAGARSGPAASGTPLVNIFYGGLTFYGVDPGSGGFQAAIDTLKTVHWDLGEHVFNLTDWKQDRYEAYASSLASTFTEKNICDMEKPFMLSGIRPGFSNGFEASFTPKSATHGDVIFTNNVTANSSVQFFRGAYKVVFYDDGRGDLDIQGLLTNTWPDYNYTMSSQATFRIAIRQAADMVCPAD